MLLAENEIGLEAENGENIVDTNRNQRGNAPFPFPLELIGIQKVVDEMERSPDWLIPIVRGRFHQRCNCLVPLTIRIG